MGVYGGEADGACGGGREHHLQPPAHLTSSIYPEGVQAKSGRRRAFFSGRPMTRGEGGEEVHVGGGVGGAPCSVGSLSSPGGRGLAGGCRAEAAGALGDCEGALGGFSAGQVSLSRFCFSPSLELWSLERLLFWL